MDALKEAVFYSFIAAFIAICFFKPNLIIGFRSKDEGDKSKDGAKDKEVV